jgi:hypothetical protein
LSRQHLVESFGWDFLIGYSLEEAKEVLQEEQIDYEVLFTAPPGKMVTLEDVRVIAVRTNESVVLICAEMDWAVN